MKNIFLTLTLLLSAYNLQAQIVNIPDANFKNALVNTNCVDINGDGFGDVDADTNDDGEIQVSEAEVVLWLKVSDENIASLEGIQSFTSLEYLNCALNQLSNIDLSQNINLLYFHCSLNSLVSLDISNNPNLINLNCNANNLTSLNVSQNQSLVSLVCYDNQLSSLDVSQNPNIEELACMHNNLNILDVSQNPNLTIFDCWDNQLTSLNIKNGNNQNLTFMHSRNNPNLMCIQVDDINYSNNQDCNIDYWCKDDWAVYSEGCQLGSEDFKQILFKLYPIPTQDILNIESQQPINLVRIYSLDGSLIKETSNSSISVSELPSGLYFAQINLGNNIVTKKFIKA